MTGVPLWSLEANSDGSYTLWDPTERSIAVDDLDTLEMLARMFLDEVEDAEDLGDVWERLHA